MNQDTKRLMWRMPITVIIGIVLSLLLQTLALNPAVYVITFLLLAVAVCVIVIFIEDQILKRTGIRPGARVRINTGGFKDQIGTVTAKKNFGTTLPYTVVIDNTDYPYPTLFARNELTEIKE